MAAADPKARAPLFPRRKSPAPPLARKLLLGIFLLLPSVAPACRATTWKQSLIYAQQPVAVYLDREWKEGKVVSQGYSHPALVSAEKLRGLLGGLRYRSSGLIRKGQLGPVFSDRELEALIEPLCEGLKRANPEERVRFLVANAEWRMFLGGAKGTSAVVFLTAPDRLNVAFDLIDESLPDDSGNPRAMSFPVDPLSITGSRQEIEAPPGATIQPADAPGKLHPRWLVADPAALAAVPRAEAPPTPAVAGSPPAAGGTATPAAATPKPEWRVDSEAEVIRHKLEVLDQLLRAGTITPEEHEKSRRQILLQSER